ncbi:MAG: hypothetical protein U0795_04975 [Pirellulales bacterium]
MNPLGALREHSRLLLAIFGVLLMIVFTIGSAVSGWLNYSRVAHVGQEPVVTWNGGQLTESEMQMQRVRRRQLSDFLETVRQLAVSRGVPDGPPVNMSTNEEDILLSAMLADRAKQMGMVVSDETALEFLDELTSNTVKRGELAGIAQTLRGGADQRTLINQLKHEVLARQAMSLVSAGVFPADSKGLLFPSTPAAAWETFRRLRQGIEGESMAVDVKQYVDRVPAPSDADIQTAFTKGKERLPNQYDPEPGFKLPRRLSFEFVRADLNKFVDTAKQSITDQQVEEYYKANQDQFKAPELPTDSGISFEDLKLDEPAAGGTGQPGSGPAPPSGQQTPPTENSPATPPTENPPAAPPAAEAPPAPATDTPATDTPATDTPTAPATEAPATEPPAGEAPAGGGSQSRRVPTESDYPVRLTAAYAAAQESTAESATSSLPDVEKSAAAAADTAATPAGTEAAAAQTGAETTATPPGQVQPLEKVRDQIREKLAIPIAQQKLDVALSNVRAAMNKFTQTYIVWEINVQEKKQDAGEQPRLDLAALATKEGLEYGQIPLSDMYEVQQYELGQSFQFGGFTPQGLVQVSFLQMAFDPDLAKFQPKDIQGLEAGVEFVFWKTDDQAERVPELKEVQDKVVAALKMQKARELARDFAQRDADQVKTAGKPLSEVFGTTRTVTPTGEFTWLTTGNLAMGSTAPRLSTIPGVEAAGQDFMKAAFALDPGQVAVIPNQPQTIFYVFQVKRRMIETAQLKEQFLQNALTYSPLRVLTQQDMRLVMNDWLIDFTKQNNVQWKRPPIQARPS